MTVLIFDATPEYDDDLWTTARLKAELFLNLAKITCEIEVPDENATSKVIFYKKYYRQALQKMYKIPLWKPVPPFIINITDLSKMVNKNLEDYYKTGSKNTFGYIVTQAVGRMFENVNFEYYHMSVANFSDCNYCRQKIEMSDREGRSQAFEITGKYHNCIRRKSK